MAVENEEQEAFKAAFAKRLVTTREEMGLTQEELGEKLGLKGNTYAKYETRSHFPLYLLPRLILETEKSYSYWLFGAEIPAKPKDKAASRFRVVK